MTISHNVLDAFGFDPKTDAKKLTGGNINTTFLITSSGTNYILQEVNSSVFQVPEDLMTNLVRVTDHLRASKFRYDVPEIVLTKSGELLCTMDGGVWRAFRYLSGQLPPEVLPVSAASSLAEAYASFVRHLLDIKLDSVVAVIPDFHNPEQRFEQFLEAADRADPGRLDKAQSLVDHALALSGIAHNYALEIGKIPQRIVHGDTKPSNLIFAPDLAHVRGFIDLDTTGPGYLINDFGDMIRSTAGVGGLKREDQDQVQVDMALFRSLSEGYLSQVKNILTELEREMLTVGVKTIIYEQFLRFLADFLNGDVYYNIQYPEHNLDRARKQLRLLLDFSSKEEHARDILTAI